MPMDDLPDHGEAPLSIDTGDGVVYADRPPPAVTAALLRAREAIEAGRTPDPADIVAAMEWLEEQERKYPTGRAEQ